MAYPHMFGTSHENCKWLRSLFGIENCLLSSMLLHPSCSMSCISFPFVRPRGTNVPCGSSSTPNYMEWPCLKVILVMMWEGGILWHFANVNK
eukprot:15395395-Heterocapsa_arctica.AAC.1